MKSHFKYINLAIILLLSFSISGCTSKYTSNECQSPLDHSNDSTKYYYLPNNDSLNFNRNVQESGISFYYEQGLKAKKIDNGIDAVKLVQEHFEIPQPVFITEKAITHVNVDGLWINPNDSAELIGAILLESTIDTEFPFGLFAGISANLFKDDLSFDIYSEAKLISNLKEYPYADELQYPLYTKRETNDKEREIAWNFSYKIGSAWLKDNTIDDLKTANLDSVKTFLNENDVSLPKYHFIVGDYYYPTQVKTDNLHYYFAYNYDDCEFNEDEFSLKYNVLTDFIKENEVYISEVTPLYGYNGFPELVNCFFGTANEFNQTPIGREDFTRNAITAYSVGIFGHELGHFISYYGDSYGRIFEEYIASFFAVRYSSYAAKSEYLDYSIRTKDRYRARNYTEADLDFLKTARDVYNNTFGKSGLNDFQAEKWILSVAYLRNQDYPAIGILAQGMSFFQYVYDTYGFDTLMTINKKYTSTNINGKKYSNFVDEWLEWVDNQFNHETSIF